jgi:hypothetical protein
VSLSKAIDPFLNDVRIGHVIDPSAYLDVRGRSLLKTSVEHDGGFDSIANTVSSNLCHVLLSGDTCICLPTGNSGGFLHISAALCVTCRPPIPTSVDFSLGSISA